MNEMFEKLTGMVGLSDQIIATDLLNAAKAEIKMYALAITETHTPDVRKTFIDHLESAIENHQKITKYMITKGYYHPYNTDWQNDVDMKAVNTALGLAGK